MISRSLWFAAGAGAGVYAMIRARSFTETFTADGLKDRLHGLNLGLRLFADEVTQSAQAHEVDLRERYGLALAPHQLPELTSGTAQSRKREIT